MSDFSIRSSKLTDEQLARLRDYGDWESYDPPVSPGELYALVLELSAFRTLPKHVSSCSNQNAVDPVGAYRGVTKCGCNSDGTCKIRIRVGPGKLTPCGRPLTHPCAHCLAFDEHKIEWEAIFNGSRPAVEGDI